MAPRQVIVRLNIASAYTSFAAGPSWDSRFSAEPVLEWGINLRSTKRDVRPAKLFRHFMGLDTASADAVLAFAEEWGPFFPYMNALGDDEGIMDAWLRFVREQDLDAEDQAELEGIAPVIASFLQRNDDQIPLADVQAEQRRLRDLARAFHVMPSEPGEMDPLLPLGSTDRTLQDPHIGLRAQLHVEVRSEGKTEGPVFVAHPLRGYGVIPIAELGILQLIVENSRVLRCGYRHCGKLFEPPDGHAYGYCPQGKTYERNCQVLEKEARQADRKRGRVLPAG